MEKEFVKYELAVKLKELGFDEPCCAFYQVEYAESRPTMVDDDNQYRLTGYRTCKNSEIPEHYTSAPTFSQSFRWFREKHGLFIQANRTIDSEGTWYYFSIASKRTDVCEGSFVYEEAELSCLEKLIEIVEKK